MLGQGGLEFGQGDAGPARHKGANKIGVGLQQGAAVTANLPRRRAAGLTHAPHQLDGSRWAHFKLCCRLAG